jgi:hypothetical protein
MSPLARVAVLACVVVFVVVALGAYVASVGSAGSPAGVPTDHGHATVSSPLRGVTSSPTSAPAAPGASIAPASTSSSATTASTTRPSPSTTAPSTASPAAAVLPLTGPVSPPVVTATCSGALAYLAAHQAPGFSASCGSGTALGRYGWTCWNVAGMCPNGAKIIHIACPAPFVYMNEAHNSWTLIGERSGIDPYGQGTRAEQAFCNAYR